jgi:murein DD-endopeptidase MepM/ murein hydrolase activator NlpD
MTRLVLCGLLITMLVTAPSLSFSQRRKGRSHHGQKTPSQLRKDLEALRSQKQQLRKQLIATKAQTHATLSDIYTVDAELSKIQDDLDHTTNRLSDSRAEQVRLKAELLDATSRLDATREQVRKRLRHMYVHGNTSSVSALVGTKSVGDIASRRFLLQMIAKKDRQLFADYQKLRDQVANRKRRQDELVVRISALVRQQASQEEQLQDTRDEKGEVLKTLRSKQGKLQEMLRQFESDERDIAAQIVAYSRRKRKPGEKELPAFHGHFQRPVSGPITSSFGMRFHPILHYTRLHAGIDFGVPRGTPIHAGADGQVITAQYSTSYGNMIVIDHGGGISTLYAHCSRLLVSTGQTVHRGEKIAASGATGLAAGPHLHWEVRVKGRPVNPMGWF